MPKKINIYTGIRKKTFPHRRGDNRQYAWIVYRDPCVYGCGKPANTIEHIVPKSKGGTNDWSNLAGACYDCNQEKDSRDLLQFLMMRVSSAGTQNAELLTV